jgi:hypothetical protein
LGQAPSAGSPTRRGGGGLLPEDLATAVGPVVVGEPVSAELRERFLAVLQEQAAAVVAVVAEVGLAPDAETPDPTSPQRRTFTLDVGARRALQPCHILTIEGREYHRRSPGSPA